MNVSWILAWWGESKYPSLNHSTFTHIISTYEIWTQSVRLRATSKLHAPIPLIVIKLARKHFCNNLNELKIIDLIRCVAHLSSGFAIAAAFALSKFKNSRHLRRKSWVGSWGLPFVFFPLFPLNASSLCIITQSRCCGSQSTFWTKF